MIEPTPRAVPTKAGSQIVDTVGLVWPFRVRFRTSQSQLPHRLYIPQKTTVKDQKPNIALTH
jgi:hypothetical protein